MSSDKTSNRNHQNDLNVGSFNSGPTATTSIAATTTIDDSRSSRIEKKSSILSIRDDQIDLLTSTGGNISDINRQSTSWNQPTQPGVSPPRLHNDSQQLALPIETSRRVQFTTPSVISESDDINTTRDTKFKTVSGQELVDFNSLGQIQEKQGEDCDTTLDAINLRKQQKSSSNKQDRSEPNQPLSGDYDDYDDLTDNENGYFDNHNRLNINNLDDDEEDEEEPSTPSRYKARQQSQSNYQSLTGRLITKVKFLATGLTNKLKSTSTSSSFTSSSTAYTPYESDTKDLLTGATKYRPGGGSGSGGGIGKRFRGERSVNHKNIGRTFRGSYRYSRIGIVMAVFKKLFNFLIQRSTLALFGAFLIHVTLGTVYTLSNINSYLTSYMRKHGSPNATYGGSMWISSSYAVGQGLSMVLGGYLERRFSARLSCFLGCALHSMSIMSTSWSIDHGHLAVLLTYGFLPGFGCGLAYMTPMSNGFGWFPNRKGLVAGVILAGFGIGTFVFNMAQTAFVNPDNLSPSVSSGGYFTQDAVLNNVPQLFIFLGTIYASMQFVGCCLLFKPPNPYDLGALGKESSMEKPILMDDQASEMTFNKAVRSREFIVLFLVFGITNQGVLFVNSMLKEYGQIFIKNDLFLAWTGSMASIANSMGRLVWGLAIDRFSFTQCFTSITTIFGLLMFLMPFEFVLSSKMLYLLCTLGIFGSFSGWMSTYPVHLSRIFGVHNSGMIYGLIFVSQSIGGILTAFAAHYLIDNYSRFVPFFCVTFLEILGLAIYHLFYNKQ